MEKDVMEFVFFSREKGTLPTEISLENVYNILLYVKQQQQKSVCRK